MRHLSVVGSNLAAQAIETGTVGLFAVPALPASSEHFTKPWQGLHQGHVDEKIQAGTRRLTFRVVGLWTMRNVTLTVAYFSQSLHVRMLSRHLARQLRVCWNF